MQVSRRIDFLRVDDRLIHGQVIVGWLPELSPETVMVVNEKVSKDSIRQEMMELSMPSDIELVFCSPSDIPTGKLADGTMILVSGPSDAWACIEAGILPETFNVGGMHSRPGKKEVFEALHIDSEDRRYFGLIIEKGLNPVFQPTPLNEPVYLEDIL